jgi:type II secretory pathway pseudopilin PulG
MFSHKRDRQSGFSLAETLVTTGIIGVITYLVIQGFGSIGGHINRNQDLASFEYLVSTIYQNVRVNPTLYRMYYGPLTHPFYDENEKFTGANEHLLPRAWSRSTTVPISECGEQCPSGRIGFMIRPDNLLGRSRYILTIKAKHPDYWGDNVQTIQLVVAPR